MVTEPSAPFAANATRPPHAPGEPAIAPAAGAGIGLRALVAGFGVALAVRIALLPLYGHLPQGYTDEGFWKHWMRHIDEHGVLNIFRVTDPDYVGYHWVLWVLALIYDVIGGPYTNTTPSLHILVKMPSLVFDAVMVAAVYAVTRRLLREHGVARARELAALAALAVALHPAVIYDSAVWAQTDPAIAAAMLGAVALFAAGRPGTGAVVWTLGFLVKPHPVMVLPVLAALVLRQGRPAVLRAIGGCAVTTLVVLGPWIVHGDTMRMLEVYQGLFSRDYERLSMDAWNLWWFWDVSGDFKPEDAIIPALPFVTFRMVGLALSATVGVASAVAVWRTPDLRTALRFSALLAFAFFVLPISTHERYLYPFFIFAMPLVMLDRRWLLVYVPLSCTFFLNLLVVAPPAQRFSERWIEAPWTLGMAAINVALFCVLVVALTGWRRRRREGALARVPGDLRRSTAASTAG